MNRRGFLLTSAAVAAGTVAGCLGDDGSNPSNDSNDTPNNGDPDPGREPLNQAIETLVTVASRLNELTDPNVERTQSDLNNLRNQLDDAEQSLDDAAEVTESLGDQVDAARTVLNFQRSLVDSHEQGIEMAQALADQAPKNQLPDSIGSEDIADEGRQSLIDAAEGLQTTLDAVEQRRTLQSEIESAYDSLDTGPLDASELAYSGDLADYVRYDENDLDVLVAYVEANMAVMEGFAGMLRGGSQFESEQWSDAVDSFTSARDQLGATGFDDLDSSAVQQLNLFGNSYIGVEAGAQLATNLESTAGTLVDIAETAQAGNVEEAQSRFEELTSD